MALGTNAFPALVRRFRAFTVPVCDYAVMTEPLTPEQRASLGWANRQGLADSGNQFHYYRLSADDRMLFGGYDAIYRGKRLRPEHEHRPASHRALVSHLLTTFPQLEGVADRAPLGRRDRHLHALLRVLRPGPRRAGGPRRRLHRARRRGDPLRRPTCCSTCSTAPRPSGPRWRWCGGCRCRSRPTRSRAVGIDLTRWSLDRADHREGRRNLWLRSLDRLGLGFDS